MSAIVVLMGVCRGREGPAVTKKIKNNFLAAVLVLTVVPTTVKIGQPVVEHLCFLLTEKLVETSEVSLIAYFVQCDYSFRPRSYPSPLPSAPGP